MYSQTKAELYSGYAVASALWAACGLAVLWNPWLARAAVSPLRFFVTIIHELCHCGGALMVGGTVKYFTISPDGSGLARTEVSTYTRAAFVSSAGYLGAAIFGSILMAATNRYPGPPYAPLLSAALGATLVVLTLAFAVADENGSRVGQLVGLICGAGLVIIGWKRPLGNTLLVLNILSISTGLNAVFDCWSLVLDPELSRGDVVNDAVQFSQYATGGWVPARFVGLVWTVMAISMVTFAAYWSVGYAAVRALGCGSCWVRAKTAYR